jgi:hypothetical protein
MEPIREPQAGGNEDDVRCLECGTVYSKPSAGSTARRNPGCPTCGYVGWLSVAIAVTEDFVPHRCAADRPQRPSA